MKVLKFIAGTFCMLALSQAQATMWVFNNPMSGGQEVPANNSQAIGRSWGTYDDVTNQLTIDVSVTGLGSNSTAAHIHKAAAGTAGGVVIAFSGTTGSTSYSTHKVQVLTAAQETDFLGNLYYTNVHTTGFGGGEVRGQLLPEILATTTTGFEVTSGFEFLGDLQSLAAADGNELCLLNDSDTLATGIRILGHTNSLGTSYRFDAHINVTRPGLSFSLKIRSASGTYAFSQGGTYTGQAQISHIGSAATNVGPQGQLGALLEWQPINDEDPSQDGWAICIDLASWTIM